MAGNQPHKPLFVLDDDLLAMDNGDFIIPLSDLAFLVVRKGTVSLEDAKTGKTLYELYAEPKLFTNIQEEVASQSQEIDHEIKVRRDWLSWAGWTQDLFSTVRADNREFLNLQDLKRRLGTSSENLGKSQAPQALVLPSDAIELFVGCQILGDNRIAIYGTNGKADICDGQTLVDAYGKKKLMPPSLKPIIVSILKKMVQETEQDIKSDSTDALAMNADITSTQTDLNEYMSLQSQNSYDPDYEVDYGTDSVPVGKAIELTQQDLSSLQSEQLKLQLSGETAQIRLQRFKSALQTWGS